MDKFQNKYRIESTRLKNHDYGDTGIYFITICTANQEHYFGEIADGTMQLSPVGILADVLWIEMKNHSKNIKLHEFVVMPNHIHGIVEILDNPTRRDVACNVSTTTGNVSTTTGNGTSTMSKISPKSGTIGRVIGSYKGAVTKHARRLGLSFKWQSRFYDHIIRNEESFVNIQKYIINNPEKWSDDELFTPLTGRDVACNVSTTTGTAQAETLHATSLRERGFTLVELVVVIVIVGILSVLGGQFIVAPVTGYIDLSRRTRLVDQAEMAMRRMQRDIRHALPNSIRIDASGQYLEMVNTVDGGRYRRYLDPVSGGDALDFSVADSGFDVLGQLSQIPVAGDRLVVYNISPSGTSGNAYASTPDNMAIIGAGSTVSHINLAPAFTFAHSSPYQRFFIVDQPISYACEGGDLNRYAGYSLSTAQPTSALLNPSLVASSISSCQFTYDPGATQRAGLITLELTLKEAEETITLLHQVHVVNAP